MKNRLMVSLVTLAILVLALGLMTGCEEAGTPTREAVAFLPQTGFAGTVNGSFAARGITTELDADSEPALIEEARWTLMGPAITSLAPNDTGVTVNDLLTTEQKNSWAPRSEDED